MLQFTRREKKNHPYPPLSSFDRETQSGVALGGPEVGQGPTGHQPQDPGRLLDHPDVDFKLANNYSLQQARNPQQLKGMNMYCASLKFLCCEVCLFFSKTLLQNQYVEQKVFSSSSLSHPQVSREGDEQCVEISHLDLCHLSMFPKNCNVSVTQCQESWQQKSSSQSANIKHLNYKLKS